MAINKNESKKYLSGYGGGNIRADQWLTEKLCALISKKQGSELPDKFWNLPKWKPIFRRQVQIASSLLIMYDARAIYLSLKDKRLSNLRSFGAFKTVNFFISILDEYQSQVDVENDSEEIELKPKSTNIIPKLHKRDNKLSRLKNIDGETRPFQSG